MTEAETRPVNPDFPESYYPFSGNDLGESRIYDYGFRDYDPLTMRWTTSDPIKSGINWFAYVGNDPVNMVDLFGLCSESDGGYSPNADLLAEGFYNLGGAVLQGITGVGLASIPTGATQVIGALVLVDAIADATLSIGQIVEGLMGVQDGQVPSDLLGETVTQVTGNLDIGDFVEYVTYGISEDFSERFGE